jgi:hypothetical protein
MAPCLCAWRAIAEAKQRWSVVAWLTKNVLSRAPRCIGRHVKPSRLHLQSLAPTNPQWARGGLWIDLLICDP